MKRNLDKNLTKRRNLRLVIGVWQVVATCAKVVIFYFFSPVSWSCRIHRRLHLSMTSPFSTNVLDMSFKNLMDEGLKTLELRRMQSTRFWPSLPGPLWLGVVLPDRVLFVIKWNCLTFKMSANKWVMLNSIVWNRAVRLFNCKQMTDV